MRIHVDYQSHLTGNPKIIQVSKTPDFGEGGQVASNGQYVIPTPGDVDFYVDENSYVLNGGNVDGEDVTSIGFAHLLARFPQFGNIYFNPLLTEDHAFELDFSGTFIDSTLAPPVSFPARFQSGRESGAPLDSGQMPTHTSILPINSTTTPERPGLLITKDIDISSFTLDCNGISVGTDKFMLYWKLFDFHVTHDISSSYGAQAGKNEPALRYIRESDQEPSGFSAYISTDSGTIWTQAGLLEPTVLESKTTSFKLAFKNDTPDKLYLANFGVLF